MQKQQTTTHPLDSSLKLEFFWDIDRFRHRIANESDSLELTSVDGDGSQPWPLSPPFQDLSLEVQAGKEIAMLVGMAGKSHWSMAVTPLEKEVGWEFDAACRVKENAEWLGSSYDFEHGFAFDHEDDAAVLCEWGNDLMRIESDASISLSAELGDGASKSLQIDALVSCDHQIPKTFRWKYKILLDRVPKR